MKKDESAYIRASKTQNSTRSCSEDKDNAKEVSLADTIPWKIQCKHHDKCAILKMGGVCPNGF
ncbi:MAG: hypothetical protein ACPLZC_05350 [Candidatus Bathyarchaeales archaeon]